MVSSRHHKTLLISCLPYFASGRRLKCCGFNVHKNLELYWEWSCQTLEFKSVIVWYELSYCSPALGKLSHPNLSIPECKWKIEKKLPESLSIPILCYSPTHLVCHRAINLASFSSNHGAILSTTGLLHTALPHSYSWLALPHSSNFRLYATFFPVHPMQVHFPFPLLSSLYISLLVLYIFLTKF